MSTVAAEGASPRRRRRSGSGRAGWGLGQRTPARPSPSASLRPPNSSTVHSESVVATVAVVIARARHTRPPPRRIAELAFASHAQRQIQHRLIELGQRATVDLVNLCWQVTSGIDPAPPMKWIRSSNSRLRKARTWEMRWSRSTCPAETPNCVATESRSSGSMITLGPVFGPAQGRQPALFGGETLQGLFVAARA